MTHEEMLQATRDSMHNTPVLELRAKRAILESVVRDAQKAGDERWKEKFDDERISIEEQIELLSAELSSRPQAPAPSIIKVSYARMGAIGQGIGR